MEASHERPLLEEAISARQQRALSDGSQFMNHEDVHIASTANRPPARPSTHRSRGSPRLDNVATQGRRRSSEARQAPSIEDFRIVLASLRQKLSENELSKAQAQDQCKRQEAEMIKLERYIKQLVDERGGVDEAAIVSITKDLQKSHLVKNTQKEVAALKADLGRKDRQIACLRAIKDSDYVLRLVEEKEALAERVERLVMEAINHDHSASRRLSRNMNHDGDAAVLDEGDRLRPQKSANPGEETSLRAEPRSTKYPNGDGTHARESSAVDRTRRVTDDRDTHRSREDEGACGGPLFHEGQPVDCRATGSEEWRPAIVKSVRLSVESLGDDGGGGKVYVYGVLYDRGGSDTDVPERRIRSLDGGQPGGIASARILTSDRESVIRSRVFKTGDVVLARNGGPKERWAAAEILYRNSDKTYRVRFDETSRETDVHPTLLRCSNAIEQPPRSGSGRGRLEGEDCSPTEEAALSPAEQAEARYSAKREHLLKKARETIPGPFSIGQEVIARYPGSAAWGPGIIIGLDQDRLNVSVDYDSGEFEENLPRIFVRPRQVGVVASERSKLWLNDAVLAVKHESSRGNEWFPARFKESDLDGYCSIVFAGENESMSIRAHKVLPLFDSVHEMGAGEIPDNPPPPTKPVRAKKHHEGDVVLACIPTLKPWSPALITATKGRGRYSVEWVDGTVKESLLFMHIASPRESPKCGTRAIKDDETSLVSPLAASHDPRETRDGRVHTADTSREVRDASRPVQVPVRDRQSRESKAAERHVRLRQRQLEVGEPVLAKAVDSNLWAPGFIRRVSGSGRYDVNFTDGSTAEDLSFLFIRALDVRLSSDAGVDYCQDPAVATTGGYEVGSLVYVLRRGQTERGSSNEMRDREKWRAGTVASVSNGRYTVVYGEEEGKPRESRIHQDRIRSRRLIRQKAAEKGDVVLALSTIPGRGWMMGAISGRTGKGTYKIAFADGSEEDSIRFVNLRRVESNEADDQGHTHAKPAMRAIRQRRFRADEMALARRPETRAWGVVRVLEVLPSGRYDLQFLDERESVVTSVPFHSMRHLDCAKVKSDNSALAECNDTRDHGERRTEDEAHRDLRRWSSAESWDEHDAKHGSDVHASGTTQNEPERAVPEGRFRPDESAWNVDSEVYVLRRGKQRHDNLEDFDTWRSGKVVGVRSNGTFAVKYDEPGAPKEDRVAENRLRHRADGSNLKKNNGSPLPSPSKKGDEGHQKKFESGDIVLARVGGSEKCPMVTVDECLPDSVYRVTYLDGSGTTELAADQLSHLRTADQGGQALTMVGGGVVMNKRVAKMRKLKIGELVLAKRPTTSDESRPWFAATVIEALGGGTYSLLFEGDDAPTSLHFTKVRPLKTSGDLGPGADDRTSRSQVLQHSTARSGSNSNEDPAATVSRKVEVTEVSFRLSMAASAARRTSPHLIMALGERDSTLEAPWFRRIADDEASSSSGSDHDTNFVRGKARPGSRSPAWTAKDDSTFCLSVDGLRDPALYIGLVDAKSKASANGKTRGYVSPETIMAETCIPLDVDEGCASGQLVDVKLRDDAGTVSLQWSSL